MALIIVALVAAASAQNYYKNKPSYKQPTAVYAKPSYSAPSYSKPTYQSAPTYFKPSTYHHEEYSV